MSERMERVIDSVCIPECPECHDQTLGPVICIHTLGQVARAVAEECCKIACDEVQNATEGETIDCAAAIRREFGIEEAEPAEKPLDTEAES